MALPIFTYNSSTGSDTVSGAGPSTGITGAAGASTGIHTGGAATNVLEVYGTPNLSTVAVDGSAAILIDTPAGGRHLTKITGITTPSAATQITVQDSFTISSGASALAWGIGGKRKTFANDTTWNDMKDVYSGWAWELEDDATHVLPVNCGSINAVGGTDGFFIIRPASGHTPTIDINGSKRFYNPSTSSQYVIIEDIIFINSGSWVGASPVYINASNSVIIFRRNTVSGAGMAYGFSSASTSGCYIIEDNKIFDIDQSTAEGIITSGRSTIIARRNEIFGCGIAIKAGGSSSYPQGTIEQNFLHDNTRGIDCTGIMDQDGAYLSIRRNTLLNNTNEAIYCHPTSVGVFPYLEIYGNILMGSGVGVDTSTDIANLASGASDRNHFYNNTADRTNWPIGPNDTSGDPLFVDGVGPVYDISLQSGSPAEASSPTGPTGA